MRCKPNFYNNVTHSGFGICWISNRARPMIIYNITHSGFTYHSEHFSNPPIPAGLNVYRTNAFEQSTTPAGSNKGIYLIFKAISIFSWFWNPFFDGSDYQPIMSPILGFTLRCKPNFYNNVTHSGFGIC